MLKSVSLTQNRKFYFILRMRAYILEWELVVTAEVAAEKH